MFCSNCGEVLIESDVVCPSCGFAAGTGSKHCACCGSELMAGSLMCDVCGTAVPQKNAVPQPTMTSSMPNQGNFQQPQFQQPQFQQPTFPQAPQPQYPQQYPQQPQSYGQQQPGYGQPAGYGYGQPQPYGQQAQYGQPQPQAFYNIADQRSRVTAGILAILLGALGVHNFYLHNTGKAVAQLLMSLLSCGALALVSEIWSIVEGIQLLTGSIKVDGRGIPLKD